jgi:hypothetical protein
MPALAARRRQRSLRWKVEHDICIFRRIRHSVHSTSIAFGGLALLDFESSLFFCFLFNRKWMVAYERWMDG